MLLPLRATHLLVFPALLLLASSLPAAAQTNLPVRDAYTIRVAEEEGVCQYEIMDYPNQDRFVISPGGTVTVEVTGTDAKVDIENDAAASVRGTDGDNDRKVGNGAAARFTARQADPGQRRATEHRVKIQCCNRSLGGLLCRDKRPAEAAAARGVDLGALDDPSLLPEGSPQALPYAIPFRTLSSTLVPVATGGPVMRVDDDV